MAADGEPKPLRTDVSIGGHVGMHALYGAEHPTWMPDSNEILFTARASLWRLVPNRQDAPARIPFAGDDSWMPVVARIPSGNQTRLVYYRYYDDHNIWRIDLSASGMSATAPPVLAIASSRADIHSQFSPDGRRVAFTSDRTGSWEIWLADPDGSNLFQLTSMGPQATGTGSPRWSPDGTQIVFASDVEGQFDLYVVPASGGKPRRLTTDPAFDHGPKYSRDGKWIYFNSQRGGDYHVWKMPAAGGNATQVVKDSSSFAVGESHDGAYLYYIGTSPAGAPLWRMPVGGGAAEKLADGIVWWSAVALDRGIYYLDRLGSASRLQFLDLTSRKVTTVAQGLGEWTGGLTVSPDGRTILFSRVDSSINDLMLVDNFR
jgi:Tol biopolymer transport system component